MQVFDGFLGITIDGFKQIVHKIKSRMITRSPEFPPLKGLGRTVLYQAQVHLFYRGNFKTCF